MDAFDDIAGRGDPLPRNKGRFRCFTPGEEVKLCADPTPTLAHLSSREMVDGCWRKRISDRLTEWQQEQVG